MLPLVKLSSSVLRGDSPRIFVAFFHRRRLLSTADAGAVAVAVAPGENPSPRPQFIAEYLERSCGFFPDKAAEAACKHLRRIKSPEQPDSVLDFFKSQGFDDADIKKLVSLNPRWLGLDVEETLAPKFRAFRDLGFSHSDIIHLVLSNPSVLNLRFQQNILPKVELWRNLLGSNELLMKWLKKKQWLFSYSIERTILPNLSLLRAWGISDKRISMVAKLQPPIVCQKPESLQALADRVEGMGVPRHSGMFLWALVTLQRVSRTTFEAKMKLMKSLGWSDSEFLAACQKAPAFLSNSEKAIQKKMGFLVKEAGCEPSYVARRPELLMMSLEKRLVPRYHVMEMMKSKGLHGGAFQLATIMQLSEKNFIEKFVLCHKEKAPELHDLYVSLSCKGAPL
ncbi:transcription termination factor MTERF6, chloroplastic/mitochondrial-like [Phoenix dactylifera]|uniref:Transcription termination factor MTERF6, chloroplastic/mitochondrial-like n=1 Tax=Phoenix dactylifera TaxID=42345 RepID=A0A8B8ZIL6_PHODC|nr:transcription termination factor MTERF6, chloroplastic/mitochondrial-like [Phoenix dactylifera]XP_008809527.2 transcription termination factor MTERF6, chloroplastic/mitochondrial-like [Phoenix dactylifera]XP_026665867.2 transcription termination factor MTERF6, chloroplastic/mitochondrial-like [Phoenix dactylifera]XP_038973137.1 transcription termination factor MTERF6, chloroplastic/mitochondrial-like [Phoenix dactylifera]XP_038973138.1 transcription termination factor MTERF6, chloroplastic/m